MSQTDDLVERGLRAWIEGDLAALEAVLDPAVTLRWVEPG
jgi:ketosteroid isomerase-like protein